MAHRLLGFGVVLMLLGGLASQASAQLRELMSAREGEGTLVYRTRSSTSDVDRVAVRLYRNGKAEVETLQGVRETFRGTWRNESSRRVRVEVDFAGRDRADGDGFIDHDGRGSFTKLNLEGRIGSSRFDLKFEAGRDNRPDGWEVEPLDTTQRGRGTLDYRTRSSSSDIDRVRVKLDRDHRFEVQAGGETFRGRWWQDGRALVRLDVDRVGWDSATGSGTVNLESRREIRLVNLRGNVGRAEYRLNFHASDSGNLSSVDGKFVEAAHRAVRQKLPPGTFFSWKEDYVGNEVFGNRTVRGEFIAVTNDRTSRYTYRVVLGAGTASVKSVDVDRQPNQ